MKKRILLVSAFLIMMMILSGFVLEKNRSSIDTGEDEHYSSSDVMEEDDMMKNRIMGAWYLSDNTDFEELSRVFPDLYAFGDEMMIWPDGRICWDIGAAGAAGTYEISGNQLVADVADIMEYDDYRVTLTVKDDGYIYMKYKEYPLVWKQYCANGF